MSVSRGFQQIRRILGFIIQAFGRFFDRVLRKGCDFSGWVEIDDIGFDNTKGNKYQPSFVAVDRIIKKYYRISCDDSIIDIGCGKGYAMFRMHKLSFGQIAGYDLNPELVRIANSNFRKLGYDNCHSFHGDAEFYTDYDPYNYFYMFNAVPAPVFRVLLRNIEESLNRKPRKAVLILSNPECHDIVCDSAVFRLDHRNKGMLNWLDVNFYVCDKVKED